MAKKWRQAREEPRLVWREAEETMTLEGENVLTFRLIWPQLEGAGLGGRWISRSYARLAEDWRRRWRREVYWKACIQLAQRRAAAQPFTPWKGELRGEEVLWRDGVLSLRLTGWESRGDGKVNRVQWGDVWKVREGAPCPPEEWLGKRRGRKKRLADQIIAQGEQRQSAGAWVPDGDWREKVRKNLPWRDACLTGEGIELAFPQGAIAPMAEGNPTFVVKG